MIPLDQTSFGATAGNCFSASVASILEMPLEDVPNFNPENWFNELNEWLPNYGLFALFFCKYDRPADWRLTWKALTDSVICEAGVASPRYPGADHSVVFYKGVVIHDPHPDKASMSASLDDLRSLIVFVAINPALAKIRKGE